EPEDESPVKEHYAHVIIDEAQDLSPMECRMIARRAEYASMTVVGDLGQATHPLASGTWAELLSRFGRREAKAFELTTGYRVPKAIADYANRYLTPGIAPTESFRDGGEVSVRAVDDMELAVRQAIREAPADGTVAVIASDAQLESLLRFP